MFETKKTLIVVYKDEMLLNQLKKMVETHDDNEDGIVGTRDDSINIVSWKEKVWMENKKAGNIQDKILFLGDIKGTDKLIPVLDIKFDNYGVKYGWAGNQAVLFADPKKLTDRKAYDAFLQELTKLPIPEFLKPVKKVVATRIKPKPESAKDVEVITKDGRVVKPKVPELIKTVQKVIGTGVEAAGKVGDQVAVRSEEILRDKNQMKKQMLFYGVIQLYYDGLEKFMNM